MKSEWKKTFRILLGLCSFLVVAKANAVENAYWNFSIYGTQEPRKLMQISIDSESRAEKLRIRSFLAKKYSGSMEGLAAQAWIAGYEGRKDEQKRLYLECANRYPMFSLCQNNIVADANDLDLMRKYVDAHPTDFDYSAIRTLFLALGEAGKVQEQKAFLETVEKEYAGSWLIPFLYSLESRRRGDQVARREALNQAISADGQKPPFIVYQHLIELEIGKFYQGGESRLSLAIGLVKKYYAQTRRYDEYEPWRFLIEEVADNDQATKGALLREYEKTLGLLSKIKLTDTVRPMPVEILDSIRMTGGMATSEYGPWLNSLRGKFATRRFSEPEVERRLLAFETSGGRVAPKKLVPQWQKLIANALTEKDAANYAVNAIWSLFQVDACNESQSLVTVWEPRFTENAIFHRNAFEASLCVNDLVQARRHLEAVKRIDPQGSSSDRTDRMRLALIESQSQQWAAEQARNPFYRLWVKENGVRLSLSIEFASGSSILPAKYIPQLDNLAKVLIKNGAEDYQFEIGGHTDSRGSPSLNRKLSEERAISVVDYLVAKAGIDRTRLVATGYGSALPLADNDGKKGWKKNRRVEIAPRANLRTPVLAKYGEPDGGVVMSPDGRYLATHGGLWEERSRIKVRSLPVASYLKKMAFVPNGRILVRLVQMNWPSFSENAIELIDTSSGLITKRKSYGATIVEGFDISSDGDRLVVIVDGMVTLLSMPDLKVVAQRSLSPVATGGNVAWWGNSKLVAAVRFPGAEKLHLLNASDLSTIRVFDDINYVHTLGVSRTRKTLAAITNDGVLHVWNTQTWRHKDMQLGVYADQFVFHPFEEKALINQWNGAERKTRLLDLDAMKVTGEWEGTTISAFSADGHSFFFAGKEYDFATLQSHPWTEHKDDVGSRPDFAGASPDRGQFFTTSGGDTQIWDVAGGRSVDKMAGLLLCGTVQGSPGYFWKCGGGGYVAQEMVEDGTWRIVPAASPFKPDERQSLTNQTATRLVVLERNPPPSSGRMAKQGNLRIYERSSGKLIASHPVLLRLEDALYAEDDALHDGDVSTSIDPSGHYLAMRVYWKEHWGYPALSGKVVWLFDLETGQEIERLSLKGRAENISFMPGILPKLRVGFDTHTGVYDVSNKAWEKNDLWPAKETLYDENGALKVVGNNNILTLLNGEMPERYIFLRQSPTVVKCFPKQNILLVYYGGGEYDYYDLKTLNLQVSMDLRGKDEWFTYMPSGEFSASQNGAQGYYWASGGKCLPFDSLRDRFERENVLRQQFGKVVH